MGCNEGRFRRGWVCVCVCARVGGNLAAGSGSADVEMLVEVASRNGRILGTESRESLVETKLGVS